MTCFKLSWVHTNIKRLNLAHGRLPSVGQVVEEIAGLDGVGADAVAGGVGADRNRDDLSHVDDIWVGDLGVRVDDGLEGDVEVCGDGGEGVAAADVVGGAYAGDAGRGGGGGFGDAGGVVRGGAVLGDDADTDGSDRDEVRGVGWGWMATYRT